MSTNRPFRVLSINGGGSLGIMPALVLKRIEDKTGKRIHELFDLICGTSVGAVIAGVCTVPSELDPTKPKHTLSEAIDVLKSTQMFKSTWWRDITTLYGLLRARVPHSVRDETFATLFGETKVSETLVPVLCTSYDVLGQTAKIFSSLRVREANDTDVTVADAVKASSAVPTVWSPHRIGNSICVDGGLFTNSPLLYGLADAVSLSDVKYEDIVVCSMGTGHLKDEPVRSSSIASFPPVSGLSFLKRVVRAVVSTDTIKTLTLADQLLEDYDQLFYFDFPLSLGQFRLLNNSEKLMNELEAIANDVMNKHALVIDDLCAKLTGQEVPIRYGAPLTSDRSAGTFQKVRRKGKEHEEAT